MLYAVKGHRNISCFSVKVLPGAPRNYDGVFLLCYFGPLGVEKKVSTLEDFFHFVLN